MQGNSMANHHAKPQSDVVCTSCVDHACSRKIDRSRSPTSLFLMTSSVQISIPLAYTGVRWKFFTNVLSMYCITELSRIKPWLTESQVQRWYRVWLVCRHKVCRPTTGLRIDTSAARK